VGINTAIVTGDSGSGDVAQGLGFAIPSDRARDIALQLVQNGTVAHPYLGVQYVGIDAQVQAANSLPVDHGALVRAVTPGGPADRAGVKTGDIIQSVDGQDVDLDNTLSELLSKHHVGDKVRLTILRYGGRQNIEVNLVQRPASL